MNIAQCRNWKREPEETLLSLREVAYATNVDDSTVTTLSLSLSLSVCLSLESEFCRFKVQPRSMGFIYCNLIPRLSAILFCGMLRKKRYEKFCRHQTCDEFSCLTIRRPFLLIKQRSRLRPFTTAGVSRNLIVYSPSSNLNTINDS